MVDPGPEDIHQAVIAICLSRAFDGAYQRRTLFRYIVEQSQIPDKPPTERSIARNFYKKNPFDPAADATVRVEIQKIKKALSSFYKSAEGKNCRVKISISGYIASFDFLWSSQVCAPLAALPKVPGAYTTHINAEGWLQLPPEFEALLRERTKYKPSAVTATSNFTSEVLLIYSAKEYSDRAEYEERWQYSRPHDFYFLGPPWRHDADLTKDGLLGIPKLLLSPADIGEKDELILWRPLKTPPHISNEADGDFIALTTRDRWKRLCKSPQDSQEFRPIMNKRKHLQAK